MVVCRAICDHLVHLGFHYQQLQVFVQQEKWHRAEPGDHPSAYRQAVAGGIQGEFRCAAANMVLMPMKEGSTCEECS
jgi:hypothetical protein